MTTYQIRAYSTRIERNMCFFCFFRMISSQSPKIQVTYFELYEFNVFHITSFGMRIYFFRLFLNTRVSLTIDLNGVISSIQNEIYINKLLLAY